MVHPQPEIKWRAVRLAGMLVAKLAKTDIEAGRVYLRRLMWNLTEESGGCAWGTPELMAEAMTCNKQLADEFGSILISYAVPSENFLDHDPLRRGAVWGVGRLAQIFPEIAQSAMKYFCASLKAEDDYIRGYSCWALKYMQVPAGCQEIIASLSHDTGEIELYSQDISKYVTVADLSRETLECLSSNQTA